GITWNNIANRAFGRAAASAIGRDARLAEPADPCSQMWRKSLIAIAFRGVFPAFPEPGLEPFERGGLWGESLWIAKSHEAAAACSNVPEPRELVARLYRIVA